MNGNLICDESELSISLNKLERHFDFLEGCFAEYNQILESIPGSALEDAKITSRIFLLQQVVALERQEFYSQFSPLSKSVKTHIAEIEAADDFRYPNMSVQDIISLLTSFL